MRMACLHLPYQYQFVDVTYRDPDFQIGSGDRVEVHGQIADIAKSPYGFLVVVVDGDRVG